MTASILNLPFQHSVPRVVRAAWQTSCVHPSGSCWSERSRTRAASLPSTCNSGLSRYPALALRQQQRFQQLSKHSMWCLLGRAAKSSGRASSVLVCSLTQRPRRQPLGADGVEGNQQGHRVAPAMMLCFRRSLEPLVLRSNLRARPLVAPTVLASRLRPDRQFHGSCLTTADGLVLGVAPSP